MILDLAGQKKEAAKRFERAYKLDPTALRVVQSYGSFLSRQGNTAEALKIFATFDEALPRHPLMLEATAELKAGKKLPLLVDTPQAGAAEVLYGLGAALGRRGGEDLGLVYLQLALYLAPSHPLALLSLADLYEAMKKPELANKIYERVPLNSPLQRNAQIQLALNLDALDRTDEAKSESGKADRRQSRRTSKPSWRSAMSCAGASSSRNARTSTPRASTPSPSPRSRTG